MKFLIEGVLWEIFTNMNDEYSVYKDGVRKWKGLPTQQTAHAMILNEYRMD